jgi:hypothetical protein
MSLIALFFAGAVLSPEPIEFRAEQALVVDKAGKPLFRSDKNFLLTVAGNAQGTVVSYDQQNRRVLISPHNSWWINCDQLQPQNVVCADKPARKTRSVTFSDLSGPAPAQKPGELQGIPSCPGDPRCPSAR